MTTVSLSELLSIRDESIAVRRAHTPALVSLLRRIRRIDLAPARRLLAVLALLVTKHGLVLSGCAALVIAASTLSTTAAWIMGGISLFFLEARRR